MKKVRFPIRKRIKDMEDVKSVKFDGAVCFPEEMSKEILTNDIENNVYYRFRFSKLEINGNTTRIYLDNESAVIEAITENIIIEDLPTNITIGRILINFGE